MLRTGFLAIIHFRQALIQFQGNRDILSLSETCVLTPDIHRPSSSADFRILGRLRRRYVAQLLGQVGLEGIALSQRACHYATQLLFAYANPPDQGFQSSSR